LQECSQCDNVLLDKGQIRDKYNIVGEKEVDNLEMAKFIAMVIGKPLHYEMIDFHSSRPGHDLRYSLDGSKMYNLGWSIPVNFDDSLAKTIMWTLENKNG
jgi:dTDP-D-glucose 4,6-dehydratase